MSRKRPELSPAAQAFAAEVADLTAHNLRPQLRALVDGALADWSPVCGCTEPAADGETGRCLKCGRRSV